MTKCKLRRGYKIILAGLVTDLLIQAAAAQCSMCKTALSESIEGQLIAEGMNRAIMLLVAVPTAAVSCLAFLIWRSMRHQSEGRSGSGALAKKSA